MCTLTEKGVRWWECVFELYTKCHHTYFVTGHNRCLLWWPRISTHPAYIYILTLQMDDVVCHVLKMFHTPVHRTKRHYKMSNCRLPSGENVMWRKSVMKSDIFGYSSLSLDCLLDFGSNWNISKAIWSTATDFCTSTHGSQKINPMDFVDLTLAI